MIHTTYENLAIVKKHNTDRTCEQNLGLKRISDHPRQVCLSLHVGNMDNTLCTTVTKQLWAEFSGILQYGCQKDYKQAKEAICTHKCEQ